MKADEFHEWASSLPGDGNLKALARLSELRNQNNTGLSGELYQAMMRQNRDQVKREFEELKETEAAQPLLDSSRMMSRLSEFFTYEDDITEHVILCHETCEESYDTDVDHRTADYKSVAYLVRTAEKHVCGDGKWKKD